MKLIGGELPIKLIPYSIIFTDSGRSSLRLIVRQKYFRGKIVAIPDFICDIVPKILKEESINFIYYHINDNLEICYETLDNLEYHILYVVGYYGIRYYIPNKYLKNKILLEDNVFFMNFFNHNGAKQWIGFNSYRKISSLAEGSLILTNMDFDTKDIIYSGAPYSINKYKAKEIKYKYLMESNRNFKKEKEYLDMFMNAETQLNEQKHIHSISNMSIYYLSKYDYVNSQNIQRKRFYELLEIFTKYCINTNVEEYSFFVMKLENRDEIRQSLSKEGVYLPIHWPCRQENGVSNILYKKLLSVPLFSSYSQEEFEFLKESLIRVICKR